MSIKSWFGKAASVALAASVGFGAALAVAAPASAVDGPNIDPDTTGSITIQKFERPLGDLAETNGQPADTSGLTPLAGVTFTITPVNVDLLTNAGWEEAQALTAALAADPAAIPANLGTATTLSATSATGITLAADLPVGLYLIREVDAPATVATKSAPFLVSIPLPTTNTEGETTWLTDVHVYPKNAVSAVEKTVDDSTAFALGDIVTWTIDATIPAFGAGETIEAYSIVDDLDDRLAYVAPATVAVTDAAGNPVALTAGTDYTVSTTDPVTVEFTESGRTALLGAAGGTVTVTIDTEVTEVRDGVITNTAFANVNDSTIESNEVQTTWAKVKIFKHDAADDTLGLEGAVFEVFTAETGGEALEFTIDGATVTQFTTDANGEVVIPGLKAGETYWLEEVVAPDRYFGLDSRVKVVVNDTTHVGQEVAVDIANTQIPDWALPLTGGNGTLTFGIAGGALVLIAAGAAVLIARRKATPATV
ncbi:SpaH/EbpB family LPXTG-anchored major pilin [Microbacterium sp. C7(2022)]|uniref:SpaH/EbpB family LPXTG-anchored major pilin n=1 Tax=Microbacterium sp. C7(2022) TaxID=2992759 RepID=UPI00237BA6A0|nr:SpaH/EbpB family LPXTG-anchored major pilin [Microbacterium sp. C7(2022)]MDE0546713.1 SpaH/EbpB family LPXTG-anchored major pilin [Microbacterium sp. C7(2022)]